MQSVNASKKLKYNEDKGLMSIRTGTSDTNARTQIVASFTSVLSATSIIPRSRNKGNGELLMIEKSLSQESPIQSTYRQIHGTRKAVSKAAENAG